FSFSQALFIFFFQAEDGIRDRNVTGVQTCALPILGGESGVPVAAFEARLRGISQRVQGQALRCLAEHHSRRSGFLRRLHSLRGCFRRFLCLPCVILDLARRPVCCVRCSAVSSAAAPATTALSFGLRRGAGLGLAGLLNFAAERYRRFQCFRILLHRQLLFF